MIPPAQRAFQAPQPTSPPSSNFNNLNQIIGSDPILLQYFSTHSHPVQHWKLAHQLMLDGLRYRARPESVLRKCCCNLAVSSGEKGDDQSSPKRAGLQKIKEKWPAQQEVEKTKHYNVSYIKHNRFLSPNHRKSIVAPKITEVIPINSAPLVIYGKPRVRIDNECGCPYHNNQEQCYQSIPYGQCQLDPSTPKLLQEVHVKQSNSKQNLQSPVLSKFKSSPQLQNMNEELKQQFDKTKKKSNPTHSHAHHQAKLPKQTRIEQTVFVDRIVQVQSRAPGKVRVVRTPRVPKLSTDHRHDTFDGNMYEKPSGAKTGEVEKRDRKSKKLENKLEKQEKQIKLLEKMIRDERPKGNPKKTIRITSNDLLSLSSDSSDMSMMDSRVVEDYKEKLGKGGSAAYFGVQPGQDCEVCSKTFSESNQQSGEEFK